MTLLEAGLPAERFRVNAVDVSARALARAIAGVYGPNSFRGVDGLRRSGYFREQDGAFTLDPAVRSTVRFHLGNLLDPALFADRPPFDVVFCRNLLIYLDDESRARPSPPWAGSSPTAACCSSATPTGSTTRRGRRSSRRGTRGASRSGRGRRRGVARRRPAKQSASPLAGEGRGGGDAADVGLDRPTEGRRRATPPTPALPRGRGRRRRRPPRATTAEPRPRPRSGLEPGRPGRYDEATGLVEGAIREGGASARRTSCSA